MFEAAFVRAAKDGLVRFEIGDDVWASTLDGSANNVTNILKRAHERGAPDVEWIPQLSMSRHCRIEDIRRWMEPFLELRCYRTLDLSGDEFAQPIENFKPLYCRVPQISLKWSGFVLEQPPTALSSLSSSSVPPFHPGKGVRGIGRSGIVTPIPFPFAGEGARG